MLFEVIFFDSRPENPVLRQQFHVESAFEVKSSEMRSPAPSKTSNDFLDNAVEVNENMLSRLQDIEKSLVSISKSKNRMALLRDAKVPLNRTSGVDRNRASGDWDGKSHALLGSTGFDKDDDGSNERRLQATSTIPRAQLWDKRNSSRGVSASWS